MKLKNTKLFLCGLLAALFLIRNIQDIQFVMSFAFAVVVIHFICEIMIWKKAAKEK